MMRRWPALSDALLDALAVLSPVSCVGCGRENRALCARCRVALTPRVASQRIGPAGRALTVHSALVYGTVPRACILALKEAGRTDLTGALAAPLRAAVDSARAAVSGVDQLELIAIPSSRSAWRRRGYDPVRLLCRRAGYRPLRLLRHRRTTRRQKTLGEADRADNLLNSLGATGPLHGRSFLIVDDVVTTGATLLEASRAVRDAGGDVLGAVTLARTPRIFRYSERKTEAPSGSGNSQ
jgi:predicted amidophosphoribosyltransferase